MSSASPTLEQEGGTENCDIMKEAASGPHDRRSSKGEVMARLLGFVGAMIGSYAGWYLGASFGMYTAFMISGVGAGVGFHYGRKYAKRYE